MGVDVKTAKQKPATDRRNMFVEEYCVDFNATQAAIRCGYSPKVANRQGSLLLSKTDIRIEIDKKKLEILARVRLGQLEYWRGLSEILSFDPAELFDDNGIVKDMKDIPIHIRKSLKGYKVNSKITGEGRDAFSEVDFKYPDRLAAVKELGSALKITEAPPGVSALTQINVQINYGEPGQ